MIKKILLILIVLFVVAQFFRIDTTAPTIIPENTIVGQLNPPAEIEAIITNACSDCHSYETKYPWYSQVAPVSWWLGHHIKEGRAHANFSKWTDYSSDDQAEILKRSARMVEKGFMPLGSYIPMHKEALMSPDQKSALVNWFKSEHDKLQ